MKKSLVISGYGGQGIMLAGTILCNAAILENKFATFFPSYGAEMRGGAAKCQVILSNEYIGSPIVYDTDILMSFSKLALEKFSSKVNKDGIIFINSDMIDNINEIISHNIKNIRVQANTIAENLGNKIMANIVMLGAVIKNIEILKKESVIEAIKDAFKAKEKKITEINIAAFLEGHKNIFVV